MTKMANWNLFAGTSILKIISSEASSAFPSPFSREIIVFSEVCAKKKIKSKIKISLPENIEFIN